MVQGRYNTVGQGGVIGVALAHRSWPQEVGRQPPGSRPAMAEAHIDLVRAGVGAG